MTEREWLDSIHPMRMLRFLGERASDRKLRLASCAYCRCFWSLMRQASRKAVLLGEQMADEPVDEGHRQAVIRAAIEAVCRFEDTDGDFFMAANIAYRVPLNDGWYAVESTMGNYSENASGVPIVNDIFGNPFRPVTINPNWVSPTIQTLSRAAYDHRIMPTGTLDNARLTILADALEEAGCTNADIFDHLRRPEPHVPGCWVVDSLLQKR